MNMFSKKKSFLMALVVTLFLTTSQAFSSYLYTNFLIKSDLKTNVLNLNVLSSKTQANSSKNSFSSNGALSFAKIAIIGAFVVAGSVGLFFLAKALLKKFGKKEKVGSGPGVKPQVTPLVNIELAKSDELKQESEKNEALRLIKYQKSLLNGGNNNSDPKLNPEKVEFSEYEKMCVNFGINSEYEDKKSKELALAKEKEEKDRKKFEQAMQELIDKQAQLETERKETEARDYELAVKLENEEKKQLELSKIEQEKKDLEVAKEMYKKELASMLEKRSELEKEQKDRLNKKELELEEIKEKLKKDGKEIERQYKERYCRKDDIVEPKLGSDEWRKKYLGSEVFCGK